MTMKHVIVLTDEELAHVKGIMADVTRELLPALTQTTPIRTFEEYKETWERPYTGIRESFLVEDPAGVICMATVNAEKSEEKDG